MPVGGKELNQDSVEPLTPRRSILVSLGIGIPEARLVKEIEQQVGGIHMGEIISSLDYLSDDGEERLLTAIQSKAGNYQHGTLVLVGQDEDRNVIRAARVATIMTQSFGSSLDIVVVNKELLGHGGWNAPYNVSQIYRPQRRQK